MPPLRRVDGTVRSLPSLHAKAGQRSTPRAGRGTQRGGAEPSCRVDQRERHALRHDCLGPEGLGNDLCDNAIIARSIAYEMLGPHALRLNKLRGRRITRRRCCITLAGHGDANLPIAGLIDVGSTLYGTALGGGRYNYGAVYSITTGGTEKVLHSFGAASDGQFRGADLIDVKGTLYSNAKAAAMLSA